MKEVKYIILAVINGVTKQFEFTREKKNEAIAHFKNIRMRADRCKFFTVDNDFNDLWYDCTNDIE